jgi:hypothetical protein
MIILVAQGRNSEREFRSVCLFVLLCDARGLSLSSPAQKFRFKKLIRDGDTCNKVLYKVVWMIFGHILAFDKKIGV